MSEIATMTPVETLCCAVRVRLGLPAIGAPLHPEALVDLLPLEVVELEFGHDAEGNRRPVGLQGNQLAVNRTVPWNVQMYVMGRGCASYLLRTMRRHAKRLRLHVELLDVSLHEFAVALCGVSLADEQVDAVKADLALVEVKDLMLECSPHGHEHEADELLDLVFSLLRQG